MIIHGQEITGKVFETTIFNRGTKYVYNNSNNYLAHNEISQ